MTNDNLFIHQFSALVSCFEQFCEGLSNKKCWEKLSSRKSPHGHYDMSPRNGIGTPTWGWTTHESFRWGTVHPRDFCGQTAPTFIRLKSPGLFHPPTRFVGSSPPRRPIKDDLNWLCDGRHQPPAFTQDAYQSHHPAETWQCRRPKRLDKTSWGGLRAGFAP